MIDQKTPEKYYKYLSDSDEIIQSIFNDHKIRFTQPWAFNDPFEFNSKLNFTVNSINPESGYEINDFILPSLELFTRIHLIESEINNFGILSLTSDAKSFDMWNLYSNGHKGFLIEFYKNFNEHPCMRSKYEDEFYIVKPVKYLKKNNININEIIKAKNLNNFQYVYRQLFYNKSNRWEDESEFRLVRPLRDCPYFKPFKNSSYRDQNIYLFDFSLECISAIAFGAHMAVEHKKFIIEKCKGYNIKFFQEVIIKDEIDKDGFEGKVHFVTIGEPGISIRREYLDEMMPQLFCVSLKQFTWKEPNKKINNLSELPYFKGNEDAINNLYHKLVKRYKGN